MLIKQKYLCSYNMKFNTRCVCVCVHTIWQSWQVWVKKLSFTCILHVSILSAFIKQFFWRHNHSTQTNIYWLILYVCVSNCARCNMPAILVHFKLKCFLDRQFQVLWFVNEQVRLLDLMFKTYKKAGQFWDTWIRESN